MLRALDPSARYEEEDDDMLNEGPQATKAAPSSLWVDEFAPKKYTGMPILPSPFLTAAVRPW
jgi:hypothetical protein